MTDDELARKTALLNYEMVITHGLSDAGVGFAWHGLFIHDPFTDPQYGAFPVDPTQQYGDAYTESIFVTDPAKALQMARQQLREKASDDLSRYGEDGIIAIIEAACSVQVPHPTNALETLTDEQVAVVWAYIDGTEGQGLGVLTGGR